MYHNKTVDNKLRKVIFKTALNFSFIHFANSKQANRKGMKEKGNNKYNAQ